MKKNYLFPVFLFLILKTLIFTQEPIQFTNSKNLVSGELKNGLKYYLFKNKKPENRASLNLVVNAGSLLETDEQQGLAHFLEHMAFNGTTKYKKNDLVKYLQSLGLSFGGDLNAYTSFSETVYELQVPTTNTDLKAGLEVLREWSSEITLDPKDVETEKNIIIEEWRLRQGINQRVGDLQRKILYGDSWYSKRFPIGFPEIINNANSKKLKDYYKKWYQPKNMSVVAVGDFDIKEVENLIVENFSSLKNTDSDLPKNFDIKLSTHNSVTIFTDPELTTTNFNIMWKENISPLNNSLSYEKFLAKTLLNSILNTRFSILSKAKDAPFVYSSIYNVPLNKETGIYAVSSLIKENDLDSSITDIINNIKSVSLNGVSDKELSNEKLNLINNLKTLVNNKDSIVNDNYAQAIRNFILNNDSFIESDEELSLTENYMKNITSDSLKEICTHLLQSNYDVFITSRDNLKDSLPTEESIITLIDKLSNQKEVNISNNNFNLKLASLDLKPGTSKLVSSEDNYKEFLLSNGIKVLYKNTDFDKDRIYIKLTKLEGSSTLEQKEYLNALFLPDILNNSGLGNIDYKSLEIYFKGKNFDVSPFIDDYMQGFTISTTKENLIESLNYFRTLISKPIIDENILNSTLKSNAEIIKNRDFSPKSVFKKSLLSTLNSDHPRRRMLELDDLNLISEENLNNVFNKLFTNFKDYKITVTGSIEETELIKVLDTYFANLPTKSESVEPKNLNVIYPKDSVRKTVVQGIDKKSTVVLTYPYHGEFSLENRLLYGAFSNLLNILLIEDVREKIGGVYSISSRSELEKFNFGENYLQIVFSTDTKRTDEVIDKVKEVINNIQKGNFSKNKIEDVQKNYELNFETAIKTNSFWNNFLEKKNLISDYEFYTPMRYNSIVNYNSIVEFSNKAIDKNNCIEVVLLPEKED
ncbi:MAG: insulinase family protein [Cetobacterium sp.]|uniref:M16 family metallopeptidase n=2 Tax=Cetobacterium sp. TaxID=2071632 RepID=UPI002FC764BE